MVLEGSYRFAVQDRRVVPESEREHGFSVGKRDEAVRDAAADEWPILPDTVAAGAADDSEHRQGDREGKHLPDS